MENTLLLNNTPVEEYETSLGKVFVKREDLTCPPPGPPFAKVRGLLPRLTEMKNNGVQTVGYMETSVSMAGWGISYFARELGLKAVIFYPSYNHNQLRDNQSFQLEKWREFDATAIPLEKPNRLSINFHRAKMLLMKEDPWAHMLPQGLPFEETKKEVATQVRFIGHSIKTIVVVIGSGTMAAGILMGLQKYKIDAVVNGIFCSPKDLTKTYRKILNAAELNPFMYKGFNLLKQRKIHLKLHDAGYEYTQKEEVGCPFPCNQYYDRKAWAWLLKNYETLEKPVLFWNIGSDYNL